MSEENVNEIEVGTEAEAPVFNKEDAIKESKDFLADLLLTDPETEEKLFVAANPQMNEDGSVSIVVVGDLESETAIMHTIFSGLVRKADGEPQEESNIVTPNSGLVGLDGQPLA